MKLEAIAEPRDGMDGACTQNASQARDLRRQVVLVHNETRPHALQQRRLGNQTSVMLDQNQQQIKGARANFDRFSACAQHAFRGEKIEVTDAHRTLASHLD
ncbi:MAG TPA: hypothetical protein VNY25_01405 [Steroidobacteraceae bacterium]|nr:hypothetical protein [Steroidobacteraceae bacterium]